MNAPDLRRRPPRRWSDAVDGIIRLPRLIDKARAFDAGTPAIVRRCSSDAEVPAALRAMWPVQR